MPAPSHLIPSCPVPPSCPLRGRSAPGSVLARLSEDRAPGTPTAPGAWCVPPGRLGVCRRGRVPWAAPRVPHLAASGGTGPDGTRLHRCARRPPPPLRPAFPPDSEPREFCRADGSVPPSATAPRTRADRPLGPAAVTSLQRAGPCGSAGADGPRSSRPGASGPTRRRAFPCWRRLLACPVRFNTIPRGLGSHFREFVLRWVDLDGGRAPWEEPVGVASRREECPRSRPCQARPSLRSPRPDGRRRSPRHSQAALSRSPVLPRRLGRCGGALQPGGRAGLGRCAAPDP